MPRKKASSNYFTKETDEYIIKYNNSTDPDYRAKIFTDHIYFPFYKLSENIIHTFKFYYMDVEKVEDLKHEIVSMLLEEKISKFDPTRGAKAYSYFGTIVKRWLINYNNKNYKKLKQIGSWDDVEESYEVDRKETQEHLLTLANFIDVWVNLTYQELPFLFEKESDIQIADAILTLFQKRNDIEIFRKKALYIYIREMTDCTTPNLTKVLNVLKASFYDLYSTYVEQDKVQT